MKAFVINLKERTHRLSLVEHWLRMGTFDWTRIEATDGLSLDPNTVSQINEGAARALKRGEIGCALSHIEAWKVALETTHSHFLFLEDDVKPKVPPVLIKRKLFQLEKQSQWDIMYLTGVSNSARFKSLCNKKHLHPYLQGNFDFRDGKSINDLFFYVGPQVGAYAYMVTRQGATKLLDFFSGHLLNPVDVQIGQMNTWLKTGMTKEVLIEHRFDSVSDSQRN